MKQSFWPKNWWLFGLALIATAGILGAILVPVILSARPVPMSTRCLSNLKQLGSATALYCVEFDNKLPLDSWLTGLYPYTKNHEMETCVEIASKNGLCGYAYKFGLRGRSPTSTTDYESTVPYFETDALGKDVVANLAARTKTRHEGITSVVFLDTHGKRLPADAKLK
ncbi:MAG: hypothetical protein ABL949_09900 [Fimbriimonadaceae bacterium]